MNERFEDVAPDGRRISDVGGESALIEALASAMQSKLAKNRGKRHWQDAAPTYLIDRLRQEVEELEQAIGGYLEEGSADEDDVWNEAADVANFAAMLADNATGRSEARSTPAEALPPEALEWARQLVEQGYRDEHIVTFTEDGYGLEHPIACRPNLIGCILNEWLATQMAPDRDPGRYVMEWAEDGPKYMEVGA